MVLDIGLFVDVGINNSYFNGYGTVFCWDCRQQEYEQLVHLCDVIYSEESTKDEIKAELIRCPSLRVLRAASKRRPRMFDLYVEALGELIREGRMLVGCDPANIDIPATLVDKSNHFRQPGRSSVVHKSDGVDSSLSHPGYTKEFGFTIFNDEAERFSEYKDLPIKDPPYQRQGFMKAWMELSASFGSARCFEIGLINGASRTEDYLACAIKGGNAPIIKRCMEDLRQFGRSTVSAVSAGYVAALSYRRVEIAKWLLEVAPIGAAVITIKSRDILDFHFLPIDLTATFLNPTLRNMKELYEHAKRTDENILPTGVVLAMRYAIKHGFNDVDVSSHFHLKTSWC